MSPTCCKISPHLVKFDNFVVYFAVYIFTVSTIPIQIHWPVKWQKWLYSGIFSNMWPDLRFTHIPKRQVTKLSQNCWSCFSVKIGLTVREGACILKWATQDEAREFHLLGWYLKKTSFTLSHIFGQWNYYSLSHCVVITFKKKRIVTTSL